MRILIDRGANLKSDDDCYQTPLSLAAEQGYEAIVRLLINGGADLEALWDDQTPLCLAAENGHEVVVRLLVDRDVDLEARDNDD